MGDPDVLVIGAGIMGVATAYHILKNSPDKDVLVVDRYGAPGQGNTGRSNAMFRNTFSSSDNQLLADASIDFYLHVQEKENRDLGLQKIGYLWLMSEGQLSASEPHLDAMKRNEIEVMAHGRGDLTRLLPTINLDPDKDEELAVLGLPRIEAGVFGSKCGRLDPDKLVRFYAGEIEKMGGRFAFNTEVERLSVGPKTRLEVDGEPFVWQDSAVESVRLKGGANDDMHPETVVLAGGAWGNELLEPIGVDGHTKAKKRQLFSVSASGSDVLQGLMHSKGFNDLGLLPLVILPKAGVHFKPVSEENTFWVACEDEVNRPYIDIPERDLGKYQAEPQFYERGIKPVLTGYFNCFAEVRIKAMWAGLYSYNTVDFLPFAFRSDNLIVVGGDSGSGIMKGDSIGRIADALYRGDKDAELYGGRKYEVSKIGFEGRDVEREEWVI